MKPAGKILAWALVVGLIIGLMWGSSRTHCTSRRTDRRDVAERRVGKPNMVGWGRSRISEQHTGRDCLCVQFTRRPILAAECVVRPAPTTRLYRRPDPDRVFRSRKVLDRSSRDRQPSQGGAASRDWVRSRGSFSKRYLVLNTSWNRG